MVREGTRPATSALVLSTSSPSQAMHLGSRSGSPRLLSTTAAFLATTAPGDAIQLWETATWTKRNEYKGHRDAPTTLAFTPPGNFFPAASDTTVLAWDTRSSKD